jgi:hypothetical protein
MYLEITPFLRWDLLSRDPRDLDDFIELHREGFSSLCHKASGGHMVVALGGESSDKSDGYFFGKWSLLPTPAGSQRRRYEIQTGTITPSIPLEAWLTEIEAEPWGYDFTNNLDIIFYVAQINAILDNPAPRSLIARIWNECLGPTAIPFDPSARRTPYRTWPPTLRTETPHRILGGNEGH